MKVSQAIYRAVLIALLTVSLMAGAGCRGEIGPTPQAPPVPAPVESNRNAAEGRGAAETSPDDFAGTAGIVEKQKRGVSPVVLRAVRAASHQRFDRVVFEFEGDTTPGYHVEYIDRPVRACGSGEAVPVAGDGWLRVRLTPAYAHTEQGEATVRDRDRRVDLPVLLELKAICDFEAEVEWVLGLASPNRYRVLELADPARLVIDIKH